MFKAKYKVNQDNLWDRGWTQKTGTWGWRSIKWGIKALRSNCSWVIGNGNKANVRDPWLMGRRPVFNDNMNTREINRWSKRKVNKLVGANEWDSVTISRIFYQESQRAIMGVWFPGHDVDDCLIWVGSSSGTYSASSWYFFFKNTYGKGLRQGSVERRMKGNRVVPWRIECDEDTKILTWKIMNNALPLGHELQKRSIQGVFSCKFCDPLTQIGGRKLCWRQGSICFGIVTSQKGYGCGRISALELTR